MSMNYLTKENMYKIAEHFCDVLRPIEFCHFYCSDNYAHLSFSDDLINYVYVSICHQIGSFIDVTFYDTTGEHFDCLSNKHYFDDEYDSLISEIFSEPAEQTEAPAELPFPDVCDTEHPEQYVVNVLDLLKDSDSSELHHALGEFITTFLPFKFSRDWTIYQYLSGIISQFCYYNIEFEDYWNSMQITLDSHLVD